MCVQAKSVAKFYLCLFFTQTFLAASSWVEKTSPLVSFQNVFYCRDARGREKKREHTQPISWRLGGINMSQLNSNFEMNVCVCMCVCDCVCEPSYFHDMINLYIYVCSEFDVKSFGYRFCSCAFIYTFWYAYVYICLKAVSTAIANSLPACFSFGTR